MTFPFILLPTGDGLAYINSQHIREMWHENGTTVIDIGRPITTPIAPQRILEHLKIAIHEIPA